MGSEFQGIATLIAALAAAIVSVIAAWRGQKTDVKVAALAAAVNPAPAPPVITPPRPPIIATYVPQEGARVAPGGNSVAEIERWLAFFASLFGGSGPPGTAPGFSFGDVLKYYQEIVTILGLFRAGAQLTVGATLPVPAISFRADDKSFRWDERGITRLS